MLRGLLSILICKSIKLCHPCSRKGPAMKQEACFGLHPMRSIANLASSLVKMDLYLGLYTDAGDKL